MGRWSMQISASDEFEDVRDEFFTQFYYTEKSVEEIERAILNGYREDYSSFEESDGIWHDVYFAIADCEWKCGALSEKIFLRVKSIISDNSDIAYLQTLAASQQDLEKRKKVLNKFLVKLSSPNEKPVIRKVKKPFKNPFKTGDVFTFELKGNFYGGVVLQVWDSDVECDAIHKRDALDYCIAVAEIKSPFAPDAERIKNAKIHCVEWIIPYNLPRAGKFAIICNIAGEISKDYRNYFCAYKTCYGLGFSGWFNDDFVEIIPGGGNFENYLKKYQIFEKPVSYTFDTKNLIKTIK